MRRSIILFGKFIVTFGILYYLFKQIPFSGILIILVSARIPEIAFALLLASLVRYFLAYQLKWITDVHRMGLSIFQIIHIKLVTGFYQFFLPGALSGGAVQWYKLSRPGKPQEALMSLLLSRLLDTFALIFVGLLFWGLAGIRAENIQLIGWPLAFLLGGLSFVYLLFFSERGVRLAWDRIGRINPGGRMTGITHRLQSFGAFMVRTDRLSHRMALTVFFISLAAHLLSTAVWALCAQSVGIEISPVHVGWVRALILILTMLPISFSGLGLREGALVVMLNPFGVSAETAVAFSLLIFGLMVFFGVIGGIIEAAALFHPREAKAR